MAFDLNDAEALGWNVTISKGGYVFSGHSSEFLPRIEKLEEQTGQQVGQNALERLRRDHEQIDALLRRIGLRAGEYLDAIGRYQRPREENHAEALRQLDRANKHHEAMNDALAQLIECPADSLRSHDRFMAFIEPTPAEAELRAVLDPTTN